MKILFLNAWGGAEFERLQEWLLHTQADVICLQEVTRTPGLSGWTQFADGERTLPQRANLFSDLKNLLWNHDGQFVTSDSGPVKDDDGNRHRQDFGIAMFVDQRLPIIGGEVNFVHGKFIDHAEWTISDRPRVAQVIRIIDRTSKRIVTIGHLHGLRDPMGKGGTPARQIQADKLKQLLERASEPDDLVLVGGDLNLLPDSTTFGTLADIGFTELVRYADTRTSLYKKSVRHANYLLVSNPSDVHKLDIPATPIVSDHRPLIVDI